MTSGPTLYLTRSSGIVAKASFQMQVQFVVSNAMDGVRIYENPLTAPSKSIAVLFGNMLRSADHQKTVKYGMPVSEIPGESFSTLQVNQRVKPINKLTESMFKARIPPGYPSVTRHEYSRR